jgi:MoxR-like ATPase
MAEWHIFRGKGAEPHDRIADLPKPPPWRDFSRSEQARVAPYMVGDHEIEMVNAALYLRRPLVVTGPPGVGKSTLAKAVAHELKLNLLQWPISSRSTLAEGLYQYDALARLRDAAPRDGTTSTDADDIGRYIRLGPLGGALYPSPRPRVLLIDEIDKSDIDLPNDLLHVFENGRYEIPELVRRAGDAPVEVFAAAGQGDGPRVSVTNGVVACDAFPLVIMTSNGERELPPAFLRRCLQLEIKAHEADRLPDIITAHLGPVDKDALEALVAEFVSRRGSGQLLATDQLLNAVFLLTRRGVPSGEAVKRLREALLEKLGRL